MVRFILEIFFMTLIVFIITSFINANAALDESACASLVVAEIQKENPDADTSRLTPFWTAICKGILDHIKAAAVVTNTGTSVVASGSSSGSWPVTSTGQVQ